MKSTILGLLAETSIHPGTGQDAGFVDLPVAREASTDYPVIVGSSFKGALLGRARSEKWDAPKCNTVFGQQDRAGSLVIADARLVALPIRCLTGTYKWVTCPHLIERFCRDLRRSASGHSEMSIPSIDRMKYVGAGNGELFLEERQFQHQHELPEGIVELIQSLIAYKETQQRVPKQLVLLNSNDFAWFARYGLAINARNVLDNEKKTSKNLWYEETIPPDSLFYCLLAERNEGGALEALESLIGEHPFLQVGGNETVGQGWFAVKWDVCTTPSVQGDTA